MRLNNFNGKYGYYSYTRSFDIGNKVIGQGLHVLVHNGLLCLLLPEQQCFSVSQEESDRLSELSDGDVLQNASNGRMSVIYKRTSVDNTIFITEKCNSNCIMCPVPESVRRSSNDVDIDDLIERSRYIPEYAEHITITGGEPFIAGRDIFKVFCELKEHHNNVEYLLLTNGRAFADVSFTQEFEMTQPNHMTVGIPIHGADARTHDWITQSPGAFEQTILGIRHLLYMGCSVEIRFVISRLNAECITRMARLVASELKGVESVKIMGLEMTGNAAVNEKEVWISYLNAFEAARPGIDLLISQGITVELYNFPLCMVDQMYWPLCRKSITEYKIRYQKECDACFVRDACGGIFLGTQRLVKNVRPVTENRRA